jgi:hypothetical protein
MRDDGLQTGVQIDSLEGLCHEIYGAEERWPAIAR